MFSSHEFCRISLILLMAEIYPNWDVMKLLNLREELCQWQFDQKCLDPKIKAWNAATTTAANGTGADFGGTLHHGGVVTTT